jgi:rhodanese-related sulfurtransferase
MISISPNDLWRKMGAGEKLCLLDVRTPREYASVHVPGASLEPLERFHAATVAGRLSPAKRPLYVICQSGTRARTAISRLESQGIEDCVLVEGGTQGWISAGLPVERQAGGRISLERQVRIVAGFLVVAGTLLGVYLHPGFLFLSGFVGTGLVFAGLTDICGMGTLLARMPWNQITNQNCACAKSGCAEAAAK